MEIIQSIQNRIYTIRGRRVMLDKDLAQLYAVETKALNQAVKRNSTRFPSDFMFQLTLEEWESLQPEMVLRQELSSRSQFVTLNTSRGQNLKYLPHVFSQEGVAMLSSVLHSSRAIQMNIAIMRAFVEMRKLVLKETEFGAVLSTLKDRIDRHDIQLEEIYSALENLLDKDAAQRKWDNRNRIGFRQ